MGIFEEGFPVEPAVEATAGALTAAQAEVLDAVLARLVPSDGNGAGAREAGVLGYVEPLVGEYAGDLDALGDFVELSEEEQDAVLAALEGTPFFEVVRRHALEGMFGDPAWGGNADGCGWELLGYPGPRLVWTEAQQRLGAR